MKLNSLHNENCLETMRKMENNFIDLIVTSPPYDDMDEEFNVIQKNGLRLYDGYKWDFKSIATEMYRVLKEGGVIVWVINDPTIKGSESLASCYQKIYFRKIGFNIHDTMIYQKHNFSNPSNTRYHQIFEYMFILSKGKPSFFNPICDRKNVYSGKVGCWGKNTVRQKNGEFKIIPRKINNEYGQRYNIWRLKTESNPLNPAPFPEQLANDHILSWSNENDIVYDPFAGSGTTGIMAYKNNRNFILSELSNNYCDIIKQRFYNNFKVVI